MLTVLSRCLRLTIAVAPLMGFLLIGVENIGQPVTAQPCMAGSPAPCTCCSDLQTSTMHHCVRLSACGTEYIYRFLWVIQPDGTVSSLARQLKLPPSFNRWQAAAYWGLHCCSCAMLLRHFGHYKQRANPPLPSCPAAGVQIEQPMKRLPLLALSLTVKSTIEMVMEQQPGSKKMVSSPLDAAGPGVCEWFRVLLRCSGSYRCLCGAQVGTA